MKFSPVYILAFTLSALTMNGLAQPKPALSSKPMITVKNIVSPLLIGLDNNPLVQVRVYVPAKSGAIQYRGIHATLDQNGLQAIDEISVYHSGNEPTYNDKNRIANMQPSRASLVIPIELNLQPGLHYIWLTAKLKSSANQDKPIQFTLNKIVEAGNKSSFVEKTGKGFVITKKAGYALKKIWEDSIHSYRIPGIATTDKGTLIAVYDNRYKHSGDLPANIDVGMSRSTDGGRSWEPMKVIMDMGAPHANNGIGDPAVLFDPVNKRIWVAALWSKGNNSIRDSRPGLSPDSSGQFVLVSSDDDGRTWSAPYNITEQVKNPNWHIYFNGPGNGIAMKDGTLVFPSQYWDESKKPGIPHSAIIYSKDFGKTWQSGIGAKSNTTEAQVVETTPGNLMLNMRDNRGSYRSIATTTDLGKSWLEHPTSYNSLQDPVCMASIIKASVMVKGVKKEVLFFSNVNSKNARENMTVKASLDLGETWLDTNELLIDERKSFGYSALTKIDDHTIGMLYEGVRELYFVRIPVLDIIK